MKKSFLICLAYLIVFCTDIPAQNISIGTAINNRAKLEVAGSTTTALFGTTTGISVEQSPAAIGLNLYAGKYMANGFAGKMVYAPPGSDGLHFLVYPSGLANANLGSSTTAFKLSSFSGSKILTNAAGLFYLDVGRGTAPYGTAHFSGTNRSSHINFSTNEDTYIRGGLTTSRVYINDIPDGKVFIGSVSASSIVGVNYTNPVYTFEVRQAGGTGMKFAAGNIHTWEWRVSGSPANFYLRYGTAIKNYFSPTDGAMHPVSDARLKTEVQELKPVLSGVLQLKPVTYEMMQVNSPGIRTMGMLAQNVKRFFPDLVRNTPGEKNLLSLNYSELAVIALKGVQEEQALIEKLEADVQAANKLATELENIITERAGKNKN